jgi:hypothetical protein
MINGAEELLQTCNSARLSGSDFPTIWHEILKRHRLMVGMPVQGGNSDGPTLGIPLLTDQRLIYGTKGFSLA